LMSCRTSGRRVQISGPRGRKSRPTCSRQQHAAAGGAHGRQGRPDPSPSAGELRHGERHAVAVLLQLLRPLTP
jgi:hypothetical protein